MRARGVGMAILPADPDHAGPGISGESSQQGGGRADQHIAIGLADARDQRFKLGQRRGRPVHLPVSSGNLASAHIVGPIGS